MVHIRECMRRWLPFVIMAASLGVSPAQDVASPDAADLDLDLVKLKMRSPCLPMPEEG